MSTLYEINEQILRCVSDEDMVVDTETGEILDVAALDALQISADEKLTNICKMYMNDMAKAEAIKQLITKLTKRQKAAENRAAQLKAYAEMNMKLRGQRKFEKPEFVASFRKSQAVEVSDPDKVPASYLIIQPPKIDKMGIKKDLKAGKEVPGCTLVERNNLSIR